MIARKVRVSSMRRCIWGMTLLVVLVSAGARAATDITGTWTASFESQIGRQDYTYQFQVKRRTLSGKAFSALGEAEILKGKVDDDKVSFLENFAYQGTVIPVTYTGAILSADEIKFTRQVGALTTEEFLARRVRE